MLTEAEAKDKWCPFSRTVETFGNGTSASRNRVVRVDGDNAEVIAERLVGTHCLGASCMAWQWVPEGSGESKIEAIRRRREETDCLLTEAKAYVESHPEYFNRPPSERGYCGLAGRPGTGE